MSEVNLIDMLKHGRFEHVVIATFMFDAAFYETTLLAHSPLLARAGRVTVLTDALDYQSLCDQHELRKINVEYLVQPVPATHSFHPKLIFMGSETEARVIIGSANFTQGGLTHNLELAIACDVSKENLAAASLATGALEFLASLGERIAGTQAAENIAALTRTCSWLSEIPTARSPVIHTLDADMLTQVVAELPVGQIDEYVCVAPYFDGNLSLLSTITNKTAPKRIRLVTKNGDHTLDPAAVAAWRQEHANTPLDIELLDPIAESSRSLHAKLHAFRQNGAYTLLFGSANCTRAAMANSARSGNIELGVLVKGVPVQKLDTLLRSVGATHRLINLSDLVPRVQGELRATQSSHQIHLIEAIRETRTQLVVRFAGQCPEGLMFLEILVARGDDSQLSRAELCPFDPAQPAVLLSSSLISQIDAIVIRVRIVDEADRHLSNLCFVTNMLSEGLSQRLSLIWADSRRNAASFAELLASFGESADLSDLIEWLKECDFRIDSTNTGRIPKLREYLVSEAVRMPAETMRGDLGQAFKHFIQRHRKRVEIAATKANKQAVPDAVQIVLVIFVGVDWLVHFGHRRLGDGSKPVDKVQWGDFRDEVGTLILALEETLGALCRLQQNTGYLSDAHIASNKLGFSIDDLKQMLFDFIEAMNTRLTAIARDFMIETSRGRIPVTYGDHDLIEPGAWSRSKLKLCQQLMSLR